MHAHPRRVVITGASRGIGAAIARRFAGTGMQLWLCYRGRHEEASRVADECRQAGAMVELLSFDLADRQAVNAALQPLADQDVDVLVNNAGITHGGLFAWTTVETWDQLQRANVDGPATVTRLLLPGMLRQRWGRVINVSSLAAQRGNAGQVAYATSKAALLGFTRSLALELASRQITVNAVCPGLIDTEMLASLDTRALVEQIPLGRLGRPDEVAALVRFLASEEASYIVGQTIGVNGGLYT